MPQQYPPRPQQEMDKLNAESQKIYDSTLKGKPKGDQAAILFNLQQKWYESLESAGDAEIDMMVGNMRIRAFGNETIAQKKWQEEWRSKYPTWGTLPSGGAVNVSSPVPELWINTLRKDSKGNIVLPPHIQMHEIEHTEGLANPKLQDVHDRIRNESYQPTTEDKIKENKSVIDKLKPEAYQKLW